MTMHRILILLCSVVGVCVGDSPAADTAWNEPVGRQTDSRGGDLIAAMIDRKMFDDAAAICREGQRRSAPSSDAIARWAIRLSRVETRRQMAGDNFAAQTIGAAQQPVADLLASNPKHPRALFLKAQLLQVRHSATRHAVVVSSVRPTDNRQIDELFTQLARVTTGLRDLANAVDKARASSDSSADSLRQHGLADDLQRLHQELLIDVVSTSLLQTELFKPGGRDYIAAANKSSTSRRKRIAAATAGQPRKN